LKKNGETIYVNIKSHEVTFNKRIARHVLANDITQIKIAQDALQESEQKFRNLFENHSAVKLILDPETGEIADANDAAADFYGYKRTDLIGMNIKQINQADENTLRNEIKNALNKTKIHFEFTHKCSDGSFKDVGVFSSRIIIGGKEYLHSIVHDVTEQKKAKHQVRLLIQSIEQSPVGIMITNPEGFVEFANSRMTDITGNTREEIVGRVSRILIASKDNQGLLKKIWSTIRSGHIWKGEFEDQKKDGTAYWARLAISPILDDESVIRHYIMVYEDVSEQKKILSELISAKIKAEESDHLKTAFLANMSHEIRTPMNGILGFMDLLQQPGLTGDQLDEFIKIVKISGERLLSTINDIIDISKIEAGQSMFHETVVDVNQLLSEQLIFFKPEADNKGLDFSVTLLPSELQLIKTDQKKLSSVIINLVKNALKFTRQGSIRFGAGLRQNDIEFFVSDTGKGIPPERLSSIFERFVQADVSIARDYEGSGLGLSIAKAYVEMMGGKISVTSGVNQGSTFIFTIPFVHVPNLNMSVQNVIADSFITLDDKTILVAEDDEISFIYLNRMLNAYKLNLLRAYNGQEAVQMCEQHPEISLILMDIKMPIMDGYQATRKIRESKPLLPIIALTAFAFSDDKEKAIAAGCTDYVSKPVKKENLLEIIKRYVTKQVVA
jgi:PAS domain S-box-containing protein